MNINNIKRGIDMEDVKPENRLKPLDSKSLWWENDLCVLFGPSDAGKSGFAVNLAMDVINNKKEPVLYLDGELMDEDLMQRFTTNYLGTLFSHIHMEPEDLYAKGIISFIRKAHNIKKINYFIIDNISLILEEHTNYDKAKSFILGFKTIVENFRDISILLIGHTPKLDDAFPITADSLGGSKSLINFCKSAFAVRGSVQDNNIVYVKQVKTRMTAKLYDAQNVLLYKREIKNNNLIFTPIGTGKECDHLNTQKNVQKLEKRNKLIFDLNKEGKSLKEISDTCAQEGMPISREGVRQVLLQKKTETEMTFKLDKCDYFCRNAVVRLITVLWKLQEPSIISHNSRKFGLNLKLTGCYIRE